MDIKRETKGQSDDKQNKTAEVFQRCSLRTLRDSELTRYQCIVRVLHLSSRCTSNPLVTPTWTKLLDQPVQERWLERSAKVKPQRLDWSPASGCRIGQKPLLPNLYQVELGPKNSTHTWNNFLPVIVSAILGSSYPLNYFYTLHAKLLGKLWGLILFYFWTNTEFSVNPKC